MLKTSFISKDSFTCKTVLLNENEDDADNDDYDLKYKDASSTWGLLSLRGLKL